MGGGGGGDDCTNKFKCGHAQNDFFIGYNVLNAHDCKFLRKLCSTITKCM